MITNQTWSGVANWATGAKNPSGEKPTGPGLTVPDQVESIPDIVARYVRNGQQWILPPGGSDDSIPEGWEKLTRLERLELAREMDDSIGELRDRIQKRNESIKARVAELEKSKKSPAKGDSGDGPTDDKLPGTSKAGT